MIELRNITKTYEGGFTALEDVNLQISDGEFVFIVGGSGAGKSTLAKLLIAEEKPTSGSITVDTWELGTLKRGKIPYYRRKLGIVFRDFRLFPEKTVYENVAFALRVIGEHSSSIRMKVNAALRMVELSDKAKCYPGELSGSEQQRVALARALANSPGVIIADEPAGNVDPVQSRELMELFCRIQSRYQKTVVVLTHDRELAESFGQRMVRLQRGKIVEDIAAYMPGDDVLAEMMQASEKSASEEDTASIFADGAEASALNGDTIMIDSLTPSLLSEEEEGEPVSEVANPAVKETAEEAIETAEMIPDVTEEEPADPAIESAEIESVQETSEYSEIADSVQEEELPAVEAVVAVPSLPESEDETETEEAVEAITEQDPVSNAQSESETAPGSEAADAATPMSNEQSMSVSTDTLEAVLADLLSQMEADASAHENTDANAQNAESSAIVPADESADENGKEEQT